MITPPSGPYASSDFGEDGAHDDLAALDLRPAVVDGGNGFGVGDAIGIHVHEDAGTADDTAMPLFTVTNPPGTVTVTTYFDGRVHDVELSANAAVLSEIALADEIVVIAGLATQDARSAQYTVMLDGMREQGHDTVTTRDFLTRDLDLPTPEQARAARAELFTTRYAGEE